MTDTSDKSFPVVGIGASAGGLEAVSEMIAELPATTGMAFLLVQHLDPVHESFLTELLAKKAAFTVETAADGAILRPDRLYVIPPNAIMTVADGVLRLRSRDGEEHPRKPVNILFRSLAEQLGHRAIAVVLSGTDSDGAQGMEAIKGAGGITMAQEPASAKFDGMPKSAIATGFVDFVRTPKELAREIVRIARHPYLNSGSPDGLTQEEDRLRRIFRLLQSRNGTDFSRYKRSTVQRRLARRMALRQIDGLAEYADLLIKEPDEVQALARDFLIRVTGFFRDPETFAALSETVFPALFDRRSSQDPIRFWVPGCSSGEEAYSYAIVLLEYLGDRAASTRVQIFGTDLSDAAIEKARTGIYLDGIADEVSPERLQHHFIQLDGHYQISKKVRELCVFARHDLTRDPPFSRLDLVSCRNLLIYLDQTLQQQIIPLFHYALNPDGFLILGPSETIGRSSQFFRLLDGKHQIYRRQPVPSQVVPGISTGGATARPGAAETIAAVKPAQIESERVQRETERLLLTRYAPASILIDDALNVLYFHGETGRYLEHSRGAASLNLEKICRPGLLVELSPAIREAQKTERPVRRERVRVELPGEDYEISLEVLPVKLAGIESRYFLIIFDQASADRSESGREGLLLRLYTSLLGAGSAQQTEKDNQLASLRRELEATREYLQATLEEHEAATEEMKSAHEEALSANEEFLSSNEELETAKEELQSANEELGVTNQELRNRNRELTDLNDELRHSRTYQDAVAETLREALLVLDGNLRIQKANHQFYQTFHLRPQDTLQRYLYDLGNGQWNIPGLRELLEGVLPKGSSPMRDFEVTHNFREIGEKTMLLNAHRLHAQNGRDELILLAIEDISDRQISQKKQAEADRRRNNFLATLAHELRNPLAPIRNGIQLLRRDGTGANARQLDMIERQIQRLVRLVDDLLQIARIESGHVELRKQPVDLVKAVSLAIEGSRHLFDDRKQKLSLFLPSDPVRVMADPVRLEQVAANLLSNAAKYTAPGGEIVVVVGHADDHAIITVRDSGIGIAPESMPQLFEMFFQANPSLDRRAGGLGIGLSVAKRMVELHDGTIEGYSEGLGRGSEFRVQLPIMREDRTRNGPVNQPVENKVSAESSPELRASESAVRRILVVDDNIDTAESEAELAKLWGHEVAVAQSGPAAIELASKFQPDIALIDIGLPEMNGYEVARRLRQMPDVSKTLLVAITGYGREEDQKAAREAGFDLHLTKPVDPLRLEKLLATLS
ncbi:chemotaxis protein CheB [Candidatus Binatus sp.]|uniref:chemotaxis protein CheB n=1 Tax=Candidatus Binatus sp. TaxID=2811406 RepID=UPI003CC6C3C9